jgi:hypothetical protein
VLKEGQPSVALALVVHARSSVRVAEVGLIIPESTHTFFNGPVQDRVRLPKPR